MSRRPDITPESLSEEQRSVFDLVTSGPHAQVVGPFPAWLQSPELARRARSLNEFLCSQSSQSSPSKRLSEIAILITGRHWRAEFEYYAHAELARKAGVEEQIIEAIAAGKRPDFPGNEDEIVYDLCIQTGARHHRFASACGTDSDDGLLLHGVRDPQRFRGPLPPGEPSPFPD